MFARFCTLNEAALVTHCEMSQGDKFIAHAQDGSIQLEVCGHALH